MRAKFTATFENVGGAALSMARNCLQELEKKLEKQKQAKRRKSAQPGGSAKLL
jgi:hypothetical protein